MTNPWAFGWTQLLTIVGLIITIGIAVGGFRTFGRWKREQLEEKRIETAIDALAIVYESKFVFDNIRSEATFDYEFKDMPESFGTSEEQHPRVAHSMLHLNASKGTRTSLSGPGKCKFAALPFLALRSRRRSC
jgi:hypothetical protein